MTRENETRTCVVEAVRCWECGHLVPTLEAEPELYSHPEVGGILRMVCKPCASILPLNERGEIGVSSPEERATLRREEELEKARQLLNQIAASLRDVRKMLGADLIQSDRPIREKEEIVTFDIEYGRESWPIFAITPEGNMYFFQGEEIPRVLYILGERPYVNSRLEPVIDYRCARPERVHLYHLCPDEESGNIGFDTWDELAQDIKFWAQYKVGKAPLREALRKALPEEAKRLDRNEALSKQEKEVATR